MDSFRESPSSWSASRLSSWLSQDPNINPEAIDALALCDVNGRMFLEMDEEDLAESDELGLDMKSIHAFLRLQATLEALELSHNGETPPPPGASVLPTKPPPIAPAAVMGASCDGEGESLPGSSSAGCCSESWSLPCISVDADGNSYFTDMTVALGPGAGIGALSELIPSTGVKFRETPGNYDFDFHTAPAKQFIVSLDAGVEIEVTDGTRRIFPAGTVMFVEDTWGKGHRSRAVNGKRRRSLFVIVPDDFSL